MGLGGGGLFMLWRPLGRSWLVPPKRPHSSRQFPAFCLARGSLLLGKGLKSLGGAYLCPALIHIHGVCSGHWLLFQVIAQLGRSQCFTIAEYVRGVSCLLIFFLILILFTLSYSDAQWTHSLGRTATRPKLHGCKVK